MQDSIMGRFGGWLREFPTIFTGPSKAEAVTPEESSVPRIEVSCAPAREPRHGVGDGHILFKIGSIEGFIYGGPYRNVPEDMFDRGVKMAAEISHAHLIDIPTRDFDVPDVEVFRTGLLKAIIYMKEHGELYAGCMGGIGRTGLFMAGMAKCMREAGEMLGVVSEGHPIPTEVLYVRKHYKGHAVETQQQIEFIRNLNVDDIVDAACCLEHKCHCK